MELFKCRASQVSKIMTNGRAKDSGMGETAKTYLKEWVLEQITGKRKEIESKYLDHGNYAEPLALHRASEYFGAKFNKNTERLENDFFTGEFDSVDGGLVIDVKCSDNVFTFPYFETEPDKGYYEQLQVYMDLTGLQNASLIFCLENHSEDDVDRLAAKLAYKQGKDEPDMEDWDEAQRRLSYDTLPEWMRIKTYNFERNDELIDAMKKRVLECRGVIETEILPMLKEQEKQFYAKKVLI
jgi:hypothetical protein